MNRQDFTREMHALIAHAAQSLDALHNCNDSIFPERARLTWVVLDDTTRRMGKMVQLETKGTTDGK